MNYKKTSSELYHHGVLGMKWGVRRYQNYDGSYTRKGMEHYRKSEGRYDKAKSNEDAMKRLYKEGRATKDDLRQAKIERKAAKKQMSSDYSQLRRDKAGDKGKALYESGKTITGGQETLSMMGTIAAGTAMASSYLAKNGKKKLATQVAMVGIGVEAVAAIFAAKGAVDAHYLRAYYGHSRNKTNPNAGGSNGESATAKRLKELGEPSTKKMNRHDKAAVALQRDADDLRRYGYEAEADAVQKVADSNRAKAEKKRSTNNQSRSSTTNESKLLQSASYNKGFLDYIKDSVGKPEMVDDPELMELLMMEYEEETGKDAMK